MSVTRNSEAANPKKGKSFFKQSKTISLVVQFGDRIEIPLDPDVQQFKIIALPASVKPYAVPRDVQFENLPHDVIVLMQGKDLVLNYADGTEIILKDFFANEKPDEISVELSSDNEDNIFISSYAQGQLIDDGAKLIALRGERETLLKMATDNSALGDMMETIFASQDDLLISEYVKWGEYFSEDDPVPYSPSTYAAFAMAGGAVLMGGDGGSVGPPVLYKAELMLGPQTDKGEGTKIYFYRADGVLMGQGVYSSTSKLYEFKNESGYSGDMIIVAIDSDSKSDYFDEAENKKLDIGKGTTLMAVVNTKDVVSDNVVFQINELTTLATRTMGVKPVVSSDNESITSVEIDDLSQSEAVNKAFGRLFGLGDVDITRAKAIAVIDSAGKANSSHNEYGVVLQLLSQLRKDNDYSVSRIVDEFVKGLSLEYENFEGANRLKLVLKGLALSEFMSVADKLGMGKGDGTALSAKDKVFIREIVQKIYDISKNKIIDAMPTGMRLTTDTKAEAGFDDGKYSTDDDNITSVADIEAPASTTPDGAMLMYRFRKGSENFGAWQEWVQKSNPLGLEIGDGKSDGEYLVQFRYVRGDAVSKISNFSFTLAAQKPDALTLRFTDNGSEDDDGLSSNNSIVVSGTISGGFWQYDIGNGWQKGSGAVIKLPDGIYNPADIKVRQINKAGVASDETLLSKYVDNEQIDIRKTSLAPFVMLLDVISKDGNIYVWVGYDPIPGTKKEKIRLYKKGNSGADELVETFEIDNFDASAAEGTKKLTFSTTQKLLIINPKDDLDADARYYLVIDKNFFKDAYDRESLEVSKTENKLEFSVASTNALSSSIGFKIGDSEEIANPILNVENYNDTLTFSGRLVNPIGATDVKITKIGLINADDNTDKVEFTVSLFDQNIEGDDGTGTEWSLQYILTSAQKKLLKNNVLYKLYAEFSYTPSEGGEVQTVSVVRDIGLLYDVAAPTIVSISNPSAEETVLPGAKLSVKVYFSEAVTIAANEEVEITLLIGGKSDSDPTEIKARIKGAKEGTASETEKVDGSDKYYLTFTSDALEDGLIDSDGITFKVNSLTYDDGAFYDNAGNAVDKTFAETPLENQKIDTVRATIVGAEHGATSEKTYKADATISVVLTFSEEVSLTYKKKATIILLIDGAGGKEEVVATATGLRDSPQSKTLTFVSDKLPIGLLDEDGIEVKADSLSFSSGQLKTLDNQANVSKKFSEMSVVAAKVDTTGPVLKEISTDVGIEENIELVFNEEVKSIKDKYIYIYKKNGTLFEKLSVKNSTYVEITSTDKKIVKLKPQKIREVNEEYYIKIDEGAFTDNLGNKLLGIGTDGLWNFQAHTLSSSIDIYVGDKTDLTPDRISLSEKNEELSLKGTIFNEIDATNVVIKKIVFKHIVADGKTGEDVVISTALPAVIDSKWELASANFPELVSGRTYRVDVTLGYTSASGTVDKEIESLGGDTFLYDTDLAKVTGVEAFTYKHIAKFGDDISFNLYFSEAVRLSMGAVIKITLLIDKADGSGVQEVEAFVIGESAYPTLSKETSDANGRYYLTFSVNSLEIGGLKDSAIRIKQDSLVVEKGYFTDLSGDAVSSEFQPADTDIEIVNQTVDTIQTKIVEVKSPVDAAAYTSGKNIELRVYFDGQVTIAKGKRAQIILLVKKSDGVIGEIKAFTTFNAKEAISSQQDSKNDNKHYLVFKGSVPASSNIAFEDNDGISVKANSLSMLTGADSDFVGDNKNPVSAKFGEFAVDNIKVDNVTPTTEKIDRFITLDADIIIDFSENIKLATGQIVLYKEAGGTETAIETFRITLASDGSPIIKSSIAEGAGTIVIEDNQLRLNPSNDLDSNSKYRVRFSVNSILDLNGNFVPSDADDKWLFKTVDFGATVEWTVNDSAVSKILEDNIVDPSKIAIKGKIFGSANLSDIKVVELTFKTNDEEDITLSFAGADVIYLKSATDYSWSVAWNIVQSKLVAASKTLVSGKSYMIDAKFDVTNPSQSVVFSTISPIIYDISLPTIASVTIDSDAGTDGFYKFGDKIKIVVSFSEPVTFDLLANTPKLGILVGSNNRQAVYVSGHGSYRLVFEYTVRADDRDEDGLSIGANAFAIGANAGLNVSDLAGNNLLFSSLTNSQVGAMPDHKVDGNQPLLSSTAPKLKLTGEGNSIGDTIVLTITFSKAVNGLTEGGIATIFKLADVGVTASWGGDNNSNTRTLTYTVQAGQSGQVTIDKDALKAALLSGITDVAGNMLSISGDIPDIDTTSLPVVDGLVPTISKTTAPRIELVNGGDDFGDSIKLNITFSENVYGLNTDENNSIFKVANENVKAVWSGANGTNTRTLTYTVQASDNGQVTLDTIALKQVLLAAIQDKMGNAMSIPDAIDNINTGFLPVVDGAAPSVTDVKITSDGPYKLGGTIEITLTFSENIVVTGLPKLALTLGTGDNAERFAYYSRSQSTAKKLVFRYIVVGEDLDEDGISISANSLDLNGGSIIDTSKNAAILTHDAIADDSAHKVDAIAPRLSSEHLPKVRLVGGGNSVGDEVRLIITFDKAVNGLTEGENTKIFSANYTNVASTWSGKDGSTTRTLIYQIKSGDTGRITISEYWLKKALLDEDITDVAGNALFFKTGQTIANIDNPSLPDIELDVLAPTLLDNVRVTSHAGVDDVYKAGDFIEITANFSETVNIDTNAKLGLVIGSTAKNASYKSGNGTNKLVFTYQVEAGDVDSDGIVIAKNAFNIAVNVDKDLKVKDLANNETRLQSLINSEVSAGPTHQVDAVAPTISSITEPAVTYTNNGNKEGDVITLTLTFSKHVYGLTDDAYNEGIFTRAGELVKAIWSGRDGTNSRVLSYTIVKGDNGAIAINETELVAVLSNNIADAVGGRFVAPSGGIKNIDEEALPIVDTTAPTIAPETPPTVTADGDGNSVGNKIMLNLTFSENIKGLTGGNDSTIFTLAGTGVEAVWSGTDDTNTRTLTYTVEDGQNGQVAIDKAKLKAALLAASVMDATGNALSISGDIADIDQDALFTVDTGAPTISTVVMSSDPGDDNIYKVGDVIQIIVTFSEDVTVNTDKGTPAFDIKIGSNTRQANYVSGSGTEILTFEYKVALGDEDADGIAIDANKLTLNDGTIQDDKGNNAVLDHSAIADNENHKVDGVVPQMSGQAVLTISDSGGASSSDDVLSLTVTFNKNVKGLTTGTVDTIFSISEQAITANWSGTDGTNTRTLAYKVKAGDNGMFAVNASGVKAALLTGKIVDDAGNALSVADDITIDYGAIERVIDTGAPSVKSIALSSDAGDDETYKSGDVISVKVAFSEDVTVDTTGGNPQLTLDIGGVERDASYVSGTGTDVLMFEYKVQAGDNDANGISILANKLSFNGGTIKDEADNDAVLNHSEIAADQNHKVDAVAPTLAATPPVATLVDGGDALGDKIRLTIIFSENVKGLSFGLASNIFKVDNVGAVATWSGADGTNERVLTYQVGPGQTGQVTIDKNALKNALVADISDMVGNSASVSTISSIDGEQSLPVVNGGAADTNPPVLSSVPVLNIEQGGDGLGDVVELTIEFSEKIVGLSGGESAGIFTLDGTSISASWSGEVGTDTRKLTYIVKDGQTGQLAINETILKSRLIAGIKDVAGNRLKIDGNIANIDSTALAIVDGVVPEVVSLSLGSNNPYKVSDAIQVTVSFSENVIVDKTDGVPVLEIQVGTNARQAAYVSGSATNQLLFQYVVQSDDTDLDGVSIDANKLTLGGGTIRDAVGNDAILTYEDQIAPNISHRVDNVLPTVESAVGSSVHSHGDRVIAGDKFLLTLTFSEAIYGMTSGDADIENYLTFVLDGKSTNGSGTWAISGENGTNERVLTYVVQADDVGTVTVNSDAFRTYLSGQPITDAAGNGLTITSSIEFASSGFSVATAEGSALAVTNISISSTPGDDAVYKEGDVIRVSVTFSGLVSSTGLASDNSIDIMIGSHTRQATYESGNGTNILVFSYIVKANDIDMDGVAVVGNSLAGSYSRSAIGSTLSTKLAHDGIKDDAEHKIEAQAPQLLSIDTGSAPGISGFYKTGDSIVIKVTYSEIVNVNSESGTPYMDLIIGANTKRATYISGSGSNTLSFKYVIEEGDTDTDGIALFGADPTIVLDGGEITDIYGNNAILALGRGATLPIHKIDGDAPTVTSAIVTKSISEDNLDVGDVVRLKVTFSEAIYGLQGGIDDSGIFTLEGHALIGIWFGVDGTNSRVFTVEAQAGDNGIFASVATALKDAILAGGVTDKAGNAVSIPGDISIDVDDAPVGFDTSVPKINGIDITSDAGTDKTYKVGDKIQLTVTFSEKIIIDTTAGTPALGIQLGTNARQAVYVSGSDSNKLVFEYTVQSNDMDTDGVSIGSNRLVLNGATMKDVAGNNAALTHNSVASIKDHKVDGSASSMEPMAVSKALATFKSDFFDVSTVEEMGEILDITWDSKSTPTTSQTDFVKGFSLEDGSENARLFLKDFLVDFESATSDITEWITIQNDGKDTHLTIDIDGAGEGETTQTIILLEHISDHSVLDMIAHGYLNILG